MKYFAIKMVFARDFSLHFRLKCFDLKASPMFALTTISPKLLKVAMNCPTDLFVL